MIQLYGHLHDYGSFSNVTRAFTRELRRKRADAIVYPVGERSLLHTGSSIPVGLNTAARVGVYIGYPEGSHGWLTGHAERVLVTVCESSRIPDSWVDACNAATLVVVPSSWCQAAFVGSGVRPPVRIVPHGIWHLPEDMLGRPAELPSGLSFLHVSGALTFAARKGTAPLLRAFRAFVDEHLDARLLLKMPDSGGLRRAIAEVDLDAHVDVLPGPTLSPLEMAQLLRHVDAVVQPSRAEGFGLVPLEARQVGTPVVVTHCTGHLEHAHVNDVRVAHGELAPIETQANPVGEAPTVSVAAVKAALDECASSLYTRRRLSLENSAQHLHDGYLWERVLAPLISELKSQDERRHLRLGGSAGLRGTS
jgi:glycosyltransferase involved in cell wall biosynthesis